MLRRPEELSEFRVLHPWHNIQKTLLGNTYEMLSLIKVHAEISKNAVGGQSYHISGDT